ncbi:DUF6421 family protein [Brevibacillus humidisoli]|uniref:DUF6421 family protein n=1 Tax=Brevibacillus humidisoli TaxID=2895522 RepID=UPI001E4651A4|nr:DUF6421 family protein [Brevibacillus humidisoli]UFJ42470.1 DUF6421 family protein [Brevibacillus humidisoli]
MPLIGKGHMLEAQPWYEPVRTIVELCNQLRAKQLEHGGFSPDDTIAASEELTNVSNALQQLAETFPSPYLDAVRDDLHAWMRQGLSTRPLFDHSLRAFKRAENHSFGFALFPIKDLTQQTESIRLEAFVYYRNELPLLEQMRRQYRDQSYQAVELLLATDGLTDNNVLNLFPEAISVDMMADQQQFALFFHNKYLEIFYEITKPLGAFLVSDPLAVWQASPDQIYDARTIYSYLHDLYHYSGTLPFDEFWQEKSSTLGSCFEEIRVDTLTYLTLSAREEEPCRLAAELFLLDRIYRYSYTDEPTDSFDCLTNYFFLAYLLAHGGARFENKQLAYDHQAVRQSLSRLARELGQLENKLLHSPADCFDEIIAGWLSQYVVMSGPGLLERTVFADWLIGQGEKRGIPRTIRWSAHSLRKYA